MEKLIELLNEFETPQSGVVFKSYDDYDGTFYGVDCDGETEIAWSDSMILSKRFQFVERLIKENKIDTDAYKTVYSGDLDKRRTLVESRDGEEIYQVTEHGVYESLLMLLSIQDNPISFLISLLK